MSHCGCSCFEPLHPCTTRLWPGPGVSSGPYITASVGLCKVGEEAREKREEKTRGPGRVERVCQSGIPVVALAHQHGHATFTCLSHSASKCATLVNTHTLV